MAEALLTISGNAVSEPDLKFLNSGVAVAEFRVGSTPRSFSKDRGEWVDGETLFLTVKAFRKIAEQAAESINKGTPVLVQGRLRQRSWEAKDGSGRRSAFELEADEIAVSVRASKRQEPAQNAWTGPTGDEPPF